MCGGFPITHYAREWVFPSAKPPPPTNKRSNNTSATSSNARRYGVTSGGEFLAHCNFRCTGSDAIPFGGRLLGTEEVAQTVQERAAFDFRYRQLRCYVG